MAQTRAAAVGGAPERVDTDAANALFDAMDLNHDGSVSRKEFLAATAAVDTPPTSKGQYKSFARAVFVLLIFGATVFLRTSSDNIFPLNTALREGFQLEALADVKSEIDMWAWILPVMKKPLPDESTQAGEAAARKRGSEYAFLNGLACKGHNCPGTDPSKVRKLFDDGTYVAQFNKFILPTKIVMRTGKITDRSSSSPMFDRYKVMLGDIVDYSEQSHITDINVLEIMYQSQAGDTTIQQKEYHTKSAPGTDEYISDILDSCDGEQQLALPDMAKTAPPLGPTTNKFAIGIEGLLAQNAEEHEAEINVRSAGGPAGRAIPWERTILLKKANAQISPDLKSYTIDDLYKTCSMTCAVKFSCAPNPLSNAPYALELCVKDCMNHRINGLSPRVQACKYQRFTTDYTKVDCEGAALEAACALPDPAFSGTYYFSDHNIELYTTKYSPGSIASHKRPATPLLWAAEIGRMGRYQQGYNISKILNEWQMVFTDALDEPSRWDTLHVPGFQEQQVVFTSTESIQTHYNTTESGSFPLAWMLTLHQRREVSDETLPFTLQGKGQILASFCTGGKWLNWTLSLEHATGGDFKMKDWKPYFDNRQATLQRHVTTFNASGVPATRAFILGQESVWNANPPDGMMTFFPSCDENIAVGSQYKCVHGVALGVDGVFQNPDLFTVGQSYIMTLDGTMAALPHARQAGSALRYACLKEVGDVGQALFYNVVDGVAVVPASKMPMCNAFVMYLDQPEVFASKKIMFASQEQYAVACDQVVEDEAELLEFLRGAITSDDLLQGYLKCGAMLGKDNYVLHTFAVYSENSKGFVTYIDYLSSDFVSVIEYLKLSLLQNLPWYSLTTKQIEFEFVTFNPYLEVVSRTDVVLDLDNYGNIDAHYSVESYPQNYVDCFGGIGGFVLTLILMLGVAASAVSECFDLRNQGAAAYFSDGGNVLDWIRIVLFSLSFILMFCFANSCSAIDNQFSQGSVGKTSMEIEEAVTALIKSASSLKDGMDIVTALNLLVHLGWIMKYFRHPKLAIIRNTISQSSMDLAHFLIVFLIIYLVFMVMANCLFGQDLEAYSTVQHSFITMFLILLGDFDWDSMARVFPVGAFLFFGSFILLMSFVMFNIILGIVCAAYDASHEAAEEEESMFSEIFRLLRYNGGHAMESALHAAGKGLAGEESTNDSAAVGGMDEQIEGIERGAGRNVESPDEMEDRPSAAYNPQGCSPSSYEEMVQKLQDAVPSLFQRYDYDASGFIKSNEDLKMLVVGVLFKCDIVVPEERIVEVLDSLPPGASFNVTQIMEEIMLPIVQRCFK